MKKTEDPYKAMLMLFRNVGGKADYNPLYKLALL